MRCALVCLTVAGCGNVLGLEHIDPPPAQAYAAVVLADHPVAYLPLDDAAESAMARDLVTDGPAGKIIGNVMNADTPARTQFGASMTFDGVDGAVDLLDVFPFQGKAHYSVEAWIFPEYTSKTSYTIVSKWHDMDANGPAAGWSLYYTAAGNGNPAQIAFSREPDPKIAQTELEDGWHHVVGTFSGNALAIYVDGQQQDSISATNSLDEQGQHLLIGAGDTATITPAKGSIDQVAIYDFALTEPQVIEHFNAAGP